MTNISVMDFFFYGYHCAVYVDTRVSFLEVFSIRVTTLTVY